MKTTIMLLSAGLLVALLPFATAEEPCQRAGATEAISHPTQKDAYIYLDLTQPGKIGEWLETNRATGLQTIDCMRFGVFRYKADTQVDLLA